MAVTAGAKSVCVLIIIKKSQSQFYIIPILVCRKCVSEMFSCCTGAKSAEIEIENAAKVLCCFGLCLFHLFLKHG